MTLEAIKYRRGELEILNQLLLPHHTIYEEIITVKDGWEAINQMKVRGAPAIAIVGCLSLAVELHNKDFKHVSEIGIFVQDKVAYLVTARPTAVNLSKTGVSIFQYCKDLITAGNENIESLKSQLLDRMEKLLQDDINDNIRLGEHGAECILQGMAGENNAGCTILTHCNTGSLATAGYGTALGVIRSLKKRNRLEHVYCTETRPYNQGARLTAYELVHEKIPATLIADSMVALLMKTKKLSAVVVGADRVAKNGDTANKIGTYQLALLAKHHNIPFYVAAPVTCHCDVTYHGDDIVIEERPPHELKQIAGVKIAPDGIDCWNPSFDVTEHKLITGIMTENGVFTPKEFQDQIHLP
ncbi:unnamed protein product [Clavelina lepadiformis]|uniref:Methylthioribose-1-phosphate isomerase n=1 Tax=Clavelina lepadiformis TaxID=159417 RepID=A0ABP0GK65_CLALP